MRPLERVIDQAADSSVPLNDVLRQVRVLAVRLRADELRTWVTNETEGYQVDHPLPPYRASRRLPVSGTWIGMMGLRASDQPISPLGLRPDFIDAWFTLSFHQPVAELQSLATRAKGELGSPWDPWAIAKYNEYVQKGEGGAGFEMMNLIDAKIKVSQDLLTGIIETIRSRVLDLALDLEQASPEAGEAAGPTIEDREVGRVVQSFVININGDGANVATGDHAMQRSSVNKGDLESLLRAARGFLASEDDAREFRDAVASDGAPDGKKTRKFIDKVKSGAVVLAEGVASDLAATGLLVAAQAFFG